MARTICKVDWDHAYSIARDTDEEPVDIVYFDVCEGSDGWYLSMDLDCNSGSFTETLVDDDGPYNGKNAAIWGGMFGALDWFFINWPGELPAEDNVSEELHKYMWWTPEGQEWYKNHVVDTTP